MSLFKIVNYLILGCAGFGMTILTMFWLGTEEDFSSTWRVELFLIRLGFNLLLTIIFSVIMVISNRILMKAVGAHGQPEFPKEMAYVFFIVLSTINLLGCILFVL